MASGLDQYLESLRTGMKEFSPRPIYEPEGDSLIFYARDEQSYAKRINSLLTVFLSSNDNSLVGCEVKGVQRMLKIGGDFGVLVRDDKLRLGFSLAPPLDDPELEQYGDEVKQFEDVELDRQELCLA
jgi:hypothetical protein